MYNTERFRIVRYTKRELSYMKV